MSTDTKNINTIRKKSRLDEIVILRGLACLFVVLVHLTSEAAIDLKVGSISSILFSFINTSSTYVVPTFVFISGFTLYYRYKNSDLNLFKFYYRRFKSTLIPYVIWTILYYVLYIKLFNYNFSLDFIFENLLFGTMVYHLYFVIIICQFYIAFPLILFLYKHFNVLLITILSLLINIFSIKFFNFEFADRFILKYIFFFILGCNFALYKNKIDIFIRNNRVLIILLNIIVTLLYSAEVYLIRNYEITINPIGYTWHVFCLTSTIFYYYISLILAEKSNSALDLLKDISFSSYTIYLAHPMLIMLIDYLYKEPFSIINKTIVKSLIVLTFFSLFAKYKYISKDFFRKAKTKEKGFIEK